MCGPRAQVSQPLVLFRGLSLEFGSLGGKGEFSGAIQLHMYIELLLLRENERERESFPEQFFFTKELLCYQKYLFLNIHEQDFISSGSAVCYSVDEEGSMYVCT